MSVKLGSTALNKAFLGSTEIKKMYLGSTVVFDNISFDPNSLFANGEEGIVLVPGDSSLTALYTEITGASATTLAGKDDPVGTFHDLVRDRYFTAFSDSARPLLKQDGNGKWFLRTDGVDDNLRSAESIITGSTNRWSATIATAPVFTLDPFGGNGERWTFRNDGGFLRVEIEGAGDTTDLPAGGLGVFEAILDGNTLGDHTVYKDGVSRILSGTNVVDTGSSAQIGRKNPGNFMAGDIYGFVLIDRTPAGTEQADLRTYLNGLAGL